MKEKFLLFLKAIILRLGQLAMEVAFKLFEIAQKIRGETPSIDQSELHGLAMGS